MRSLGSWITTLGRPAAEPIRHAYLHVPFCASICPFCSFHVKVRARGDVADYLDRLEVELTEVAAALPIELDTLYVGGGTPSYLRGDELERMWAIIEATIGRPRVEATLEVFPANATEARVRHWVDLGFTRLSIGVQSFDDSVLATLGRDHSVAQSRAAIEWSLQHAPVTSLDLMTPVAHQDIASDVAAALRSGVDHISVYALTIEPGTPFSIEGRIVDDGDAVSALDAAAELLAAGNFERYEVSNYARPSKRCVHNQAYWRAAPCLAIGPSASGLVAMEDGSLVRFTNPDLGTWMGSDLRIVGADDRHERMRGEDLMGELLFCGLRLVEGIDLDVVTRRSGLDPRVERRSAIERHVENGLLRLDETTLAATDAGRLLLDSVCVDLL